MLCREPVKIAAPLDIAWAWLAHSLDPETYRRDFHELTNDTPPAASAPHRRDKEALEAVSGIPSRQAARCTHTSYCQVSMSEGHGKLPSLHMYLSGQSLAAEGDQF